jgi:signal transduction histidine kinase
MKLSTRILIAFAIVLVLSVFDTLSNYVLSLKVEENTRFLGRSQEIIRNSARLHKEIIETQNAYRGFLISRDSAFTSIYRANLTTIPVLFDQQQQLINNNPEQINLLDSIKSLYYQWLGYSGYSMNPGQMIRNSITDTSIRNAESLKNQLGQQINEKITVQFSTFDKFEYGIRSIHAANLAQSIHTAHLFSLTFFILTILIGVATTAYIITLILKRIKTMVRLAEDISSGNFTTVTDIQNDEMTRLSISLNAMSGSLRRNINELEKRNSELDKFAYVVSHDLKAPLRGIHNVVKWIEEDLSKELSPELKNYLSIISERTGRMENLINGLLAYARTREKMKPEMTDVTELLKVITETVIPPGVKVTLLNPPVLFTERLKLEQVFTNLFTNAVKHLPVTGGEIVISCEESTGYFRFSVKDNGTGIDPRYHQKIFELFQTLREKNEEQSTGIGLAIIKKIIEDIHGTITVRSALGEGAEFIFTWPKNLLL